MYRLERFVDASNKAIALGNSTKNQNNYIDSLSDAILSSTDVDLTGITDTQQNGERVPSLQNPDIVVKINPAEDPKSELSILQNKCTSSTLDELILGANPNDRYGCGWLYDNSVSRGYAGGIEGPLNLFGEGPLPGKWYFDLQDAKKQILLDKCSKVNCANVNKECGYCPFTRRSVPMDASGNPLYNDTWDNGCISNLITDPSNCPKKVPITIPPALKQQCTPIGDRLSPQCLRNVLLTKCSDKGSLAIALTKPDPRDYVRNINPDMYKYITDNLGIFKKGGTTIEEVLGAVDKISENSKFSNSNGYASRDLCLESGAFDRYYDCSTISDTTKGPYALKCLQDIFIKKGGNPKGTLYPCTNNIGLYNNVPSIGAIKGILDSIIKDTKSPDFYRQRTAITYMYGIKDPNVRF